MSKLNSVKIMQFSDREGQMVAGFTPEHAVYDANGVRLDVKLKALDVDRILALLKRYSGGGGGGISAIFTVGNNESGFAEAVAEVMRDTNDSTSAEGGAPYNTYLAVLKIEPYNFMRIEFTGSEPKAYALAKVSTCTSGGIDVIFDLDFYSYRYHFSLAILDSQGNPTSKLYFEESGISKTN